MTYSFQQLASILAGKIAIQDHQLSIKEISIDTRRVLNPFHTVFFALKGIRNNGHHYIDDAYNKGIRTFVISEPADDYFSKIKNTGCAVLVVENTLEALQQLCKHHRSQFNIPVIGVTGSNGKTIIKEWLFQLLSQEERIIRSPKSYNSQIGVPLSVWNIEPQHSLAIFEAGISKSGEMAKLAAIIQPTIGIFTNIGPAHAGGFSSDSEKIKEKALLFKNCETVIYCRDHFPIDHFLKNQQTFTWGMANADIIVKKVSTSLQITTLTVEYQRLSKEIVLPFSDEASIENALHCITLMIYKGYSLDKISERISHIRNMPMRLELKYGINECTLIDDSYSADFLSLKIALEFYAQQEGKKKRTLIISEFEDAGIDEEAFCEQLNTFLEEYKIEKLVGVGNVFITHRNMLDTSELEYYAYPNTNAILQDIENLTFDRELILLKGARSYSFEKLSQYLQGQSHRTILEVNLSALIHNLNVYRSLLPKETGIIAMVKAYSYGSGSVELAHLLQSENVEYLAVAYADEGIALRKSGIHMPIMVLNPDPGEFPIMAHYQLEPEIYSVKQWEQLKHFLAHFEEHSPLKIHIKIETGMNRLGLNESEILEIMPGIAQEKKLQVSTIFSHLAASDEPSLDDFSKAQIVRFQLLSKIAEQFLPYPVKKHLSNSSAIVRFPEAGFDFVRLGIGLYGIDSSATIQTRLQTIGYLKTRISQIKQVHPGDTVGYSRKGIIETEGKVAVLAIGYADGYDRRFSNGIGKVNIRGQEAKVIGNVCMDMTMVDITHIPDAEEGDEVEIYGNSISIIEMAKAIGTIPYELLTSISSRVKRVYFWD